MATPWGAIASGASGLIGGLINKIGQKKTEKRQVQYQKDLADYQYSKDVDMWSMANEYNKPAAQMGRLEEAGLNPHLVYGSGSVVGNTSTQTPKYQNPGTQFKNVPIADPQAMLSQYNQFTQTQQNIDSMKAMERLNNQKAGTEAINQGLKIQSFGHKGELFKYDRQIKGSIINKNIQQLSNLLMQNAGQGIKNQMDTETLDRMKRGIFPGDNPFRFIMDQFGKKYNQFKTYYNKGDKGQFDFLK